MLKKSFRLTLAKPLKFDKKFKTDLFILEIGESFDPYPRFAVVVPTKFCKKANARNRTKRLVFEGLSLLKDKVKISNYKILVLGNFSKLKLAQVYKSLEKVFDKADLLINA